MDLKESFILKTICHILLPIMIVTAIFTTVVIFVSEEYPELKEKKDFFQTKMFSDQYISQIGNTVYAIRRQSTESDEPIEYRSYDNQGIFYLVINNETGIAYTNIEKTGNTDTIDKLKEFFDNKQNIAYWVYDGQVKTSIPNLEEIQIKYNYYFEDIIADHYSIYSCLDEERIESLNSSFINANIAASLVSNTYEASYFLLPISLIATVIIFVYLTVGIGHKKGVEGIFLRKFDTIALELVAFFFFWLLFFSAIPVMAAVQIYSAWGLVITGVSLALIYVILWFAYVTFIRRVKAGTLLKNTLVYKAWRGCKKIVREILGNFNVNLKLVLFYGGFVLLSAILLMSARSSGLALLLLLALYAGAFLYLFFYVKKCMEIKKALKNLYEGKKEITLKEDEFKGELKDICIYVNDISAGFTNAIEESLKNERFKTDLITNVSHDIKTPLTSIINYVDLLKEEGLESENAKEYLRIIDEKSLKLKKLTEDLVEASKASSGNIKLNLEEININELIRQITGEFKDKFSEKNLEPIITEAEEDIKITADGKQLSRVFDNLFSNIAKYAMPNTRVYIDIKKSENKTKIELKNISNQKLNITAEELMQRFVRGDSSRNTEGSGLGLSIAQSLVELQNGTFQLFLDGDFFRVTIEF